MGRISPGGGRAFFDMSMTVGFCDTTLFLDEDKKETAASISQKPPHKNRRVKISLLYDDFFSFAVVRQIVYFNFAF